MNCPLCTSPIRSTEHSEILKGIGIVHADCAQEWRDYRELDMIEDREIARDYEADRGI